MLAAAKLNSFYKGLFPYFLALSIALVMGYVVSKGEPMLTVLLASAIGAVFLILQPVTLLWAVLFMTLLVSGLVQYFIPSLNKIWWATYGAGALLFIPGIMARVTGQTPRPDSPSWPTIAVLSFVVVVLFSSLLNKIPLWQFILSMKSVFMFGGVWLALASLPISREVMKRWLIGFAAIGLIQFLPTIYQYLFVRTARITSGRAVEAFDSVVGTFGGSMEGGGSSGALAGYLVILITLLLAFYRDRLLEGKKLFLLLVLLGIPLLLMEVKVVFVYLPVALLLLYKDAALRKPGTFVAGVLFAAVLLGGVLLAYQTFHWSSSGRSMQSNVEAMFSYSFNEQSQGIKEDEGVMTRRQVLDFWWERNGADNPVTTLIGHGLGASGTTGMSVGTVASRYVPMYIDRTGMSILLWDTGLLGTALVVGMMFAGYRLARRLSYSTRLDPWQLSLARGLQAVMPLFLLFLLYRNDIPYAAHTMFMLMTLFGLLAWLRNQEITHNAG